MSSLAGEVTTDGDANASSGEIDTSATEVAANGEANAINFNATIDGNSVSDSAGEGSFASAAGPFDLASADTTGSADADVNVTNNSNTGSG